MSKFIFSLFFVISWHVGADKIRVVTEHLPPHQIANNGQVVGGASYHIVKEVLKRAKIEATSEVMPWARAYKIGLNRKNTIIYSLTRSQERESLFKWIGQLHSMEYHFFSTKSNQNVNIKTAKDALNYTVVSVRNSFEANSLQDQGFRVGENLILVVDYTTAWKILQMGRADITYANAPILKFSNFGDSLFKKQSDVIETFKLYVAVNLDTDKKIIDDLLAAFTSVKEDASFKELFINFDDK